MRLAERQCGPTLKAKPKARHFHRLLALLDALRTGRARERSLAAKLMEAELMRSELRAHDAS